MKDLPRKFEHLYKFSKLDELKKKYNITPEYKAWTCLTPASSGTDIMVVDMEGAAVGDGKPSAETLLHTQLYRRLPDCGAVLHTHSHASTVLTMHWPADHITLEGYELLKALDGVQTHDTRLTIRCLKTARTSPRWRPRWTGPWRPATPATPT